MSALIVDPIAHALDEAIMEAQRVRMKWDASKHVLGPLDEALRALNVEPYFSYSDWYCIAATGDAKQLRAILLAIEKAGYTTSEGKPLPGASSWNPLFSNAGLPTVYLNFTSSVCKRIQVGTETKEVPIFKTVCGEFAALEDAETVLNIEALL